MHWNAGFARNRKGVLSSSSRDENDERAQKDAKLRAPRAAYRVGLEALCSEYEQDDKPRGPRGFGGGVRIGISLATHFPDGVCLGMFHFPPWIDRTRPGLGLILVLAPAYLVGMFYYASSPETLDTGYSPKQPVAFSHALHAGQLGMDCRYCHSTVERAAHAAIPPTATCMNCHSLIAVDSEKLLPVRKSYTSGQPIPWVRVHDLPDFAFFDHSAHVTRGVSCVSCHGRIDKMEQVTQVMTLRMGWCLECHRNPEPHLRPKELVTQLDWIPGEDQQQIGRRLRQEYNINPSTDCSTCHR